MDLHGFVALSLLPASLVQALLRPALSESEDVAHGWSSSDLSGLASLASAPGAGAIGPGGHRCIEWARRRTGRALEDATRLALAVVPLGDDRYPPLLAAIPDPPIVLWVRGDCGVLRDAAVAIVGSRAASRYGLDVAAHLAMELGRAGATVVSGLARGVDSAAHRGAVEARARTVAVLGSGVDVVYPPEHRALAEAIAADGAVVSELPPGAPPKPQHFPLRNRIISGLSLAVVVVEASERSGSLITARRALEQGREVLAVPGNILSGRHRGTHGLLRDGAKIVETADDILEELKWPARCSSPPGSEPAEDGIVQHMRMGETYDLDELARMTRLASRVLLPRLLQLELDGLVTRVSGARFLRSRRKW
ncbi:MAG: DNA-protecting protein DprA [Acidobacteria bacterium]|nr:DNA-protecting protein DprA [Acidobacteriota bacterium]